MAGTDKHDENQQLDDFLDSNQDVLNLLQRVWQTTAPSANHPVETHVDRETHGGIPSDDNSIGIDSLNPACVTAAGDIPQQIGRYEIKKLLGQGGFGMVFLAYDPKLKREVALKIPRPEAVVTLELRSRFVREAETAAALNHANIVPVFEAGNFGPICYIAAAYCPGQSMAQWIASADQLPDPKTAAQLVATLADAVEHAHLRGVVHRDLKPDNILLDTNLWPKITDFGLAKLLDDDSNVTRSGAMVGTPNYMAPEQTDSRFGVSDTSADIYSLGAILYFLLTGRPPFGGESLLRTIQAVQDQSPVVPRKLRPEVPRDLESICLKCLEKQQSKRYASATELQSDLLRFLDCRPIIARRQTAVDRVWLWCRRRPAVTGLVAALVLVLAVSSIVLSGLLLKSDLLKRQALDSAVIADTERQRARDALDAMTSQVASDWLVEQKNLTPSQRRFLDNAVAHYRGFASINIVDSEDHQWVANAEHRLGELLDRLGQHDKAAESFDRAIDLYHRLIETDGTAAIQHQLAKSLLAKQMSTAQQGDFPGAEAIGREALTACEQILVAEPDNSEFLATSSKILGAQAVHLRRQGKLDEALQCSHQSLLVRERLVSQFPANVEFQRMLTTSLNDYASILASKQRFSEAEKLLTKSLEITKALAENDPENASLQSELAFGYGNLGAIFARTGKQDEMLDPLRKATQAFQMLVRDFPSEDRFRQHYVNTWGNLVAVLAIAKRWHEVESEAQQLVSTSEKYYQLYPDTINYRWVMNLARTQLGRAVSAGGDPAKAIKHFTTAIDDLQELCDQNPGMNRALGTLKMALENRATAQSMVDQHEQAILDWDAAIKLAPPPQQNGLRLAKAAALVAVGNMSAAIDDVAAILAETDDKSNYELFYDAARVYASASAGSKDGTQAEQFAMQAIGLLKKAADMGFSDIQQLGNEPEFKPLKQYAAYRDLVRQLHQGHE